MLGNAAVAVGLALLALAVGCVCRSPVVRHAAWVIVLLKLVTPPLVIVPLPVLPESWGSPSGGNPNIEIRASKQSEPNPKTETRNEVQPPGGPDFGFRISYFEFSLAVWLVGAIGWFAWQGRRIVRFRRRVASAEDAPVEVAAAASRLATALGIAHPPQVKVASGIGSPMLWGSVRGTVVLFPRELLARLAPEARDTL